MIEFNKIEIGDEVRVAEGLWFVVAGKGHEGLGPNALLLRDLDGNCDGTPIDFIFITDWQPKTFEWITDEMMAKALFGDANIVIGKDAMKAKNVLNRLLSKHYKRP